MKPYSYIDLENGEVEKTTTGKFDGIYFLRVGNKSVAVARFKRLKSILPVKVSQLTEKTKKRLNIPSGLPGSFDLPRS